MDNNILSLISYGIASAGIYMAKRLENKLEQQRQDKNSFYNKQNEYWDKKAQLLEQQVGEANYQKARQAVIDCVYRVEEIGKEALWDGLTKHSKVTEWASQNTGLSEEQIFDLIKTTVGMINSGLDKLTKTVSTPVTINTSSSVEEASKEIGATIANSIQQSISKI